MKIGIICNPWLGGAGALPTELGKVLALRGHQVHFFAFDVPFRLIGPWRENIYFHKIESFEYPAFNNPPDGLTAGNLIAEVAIREGVKILNPHFAGANSEAAFIAKEIMESKGHKVSILNTLHGSDISVLGQESLIREAMMLMLKKSDATMTVSNALATEAAKTYDLENVHVIHNFVDTELFKPRANKYSSSVRKLFARPDQKLIFHSSNFRSIKRISDVIGVFAKIAQKTPSKLMLIGEGPDQQVASRLASKYKIVDKIHFLGFQSDMAKLLPLADLFLLPSEKENFSLAALESMSCGVPVISSNVGGMSEMIDHEKNGFLAEVGDVETMSSYAIDILKDEAKLQEYSKEARKKVVENFTPGIIVPKYEKLFSEIIKESGE